MSTIQPIKNNVILRSVFFISDGTGLTAESYGASLLARFPDLAFATITLSFIDTKEKAVRACKQINEAHSLSGLQPVVFSTLVGQPAQEIFDQSTCCFIDLFHTFLTPLERCFNVESAHTETCIRTNMNDKSYALRLNAIDYALSHDDGLRPDQYDAADIILVGVSRCGKTPTSLYLAMNFSLKVSNYPLVDEDLHLQKLPDNLLQYKHKLVGLTIKPVPLSRIRKQRRPNSDYSSLDVCQREIEIANSLFVRSSLPVIDSTAISIEEIASKIVKRLKISRERLGFI
jgi:regulator of PEP synthase PpsR (kinase-PPPase family)